MTIPGKALRAALPLLLGLGATALAAPPGPRDPDWPCQAIKVPDMALAAIWTGPSVAPFAATWSKDKEVADLAARLAQRRVPMAQATAEIDAFAKQAGDGRKDRLLALLAGLFDTLNAERGSVIAGLDRFGARQKQLATEIRTQVDALHALQADPKADAQRVADLGDRLELETRLFEERRQATQYACAVPDEIEQRLYGLARAIQQALG